jgi:predicted nucleic acid binding AN1-type Zn finger protein
MGNCKYIECKHKISKLIGHCKSCEKNFCSKHRYPETHNCPMLLEIRLNSKQDLIKKLQDSSIQVHKLMKI